MLAAAKVHEVCWALTATKVRKEVQYRFTPGDAQLKYSMANLRSALSRKGIKYYQYGLSRNHVELMQKLVADYPATAWVSNGMVMSITEEEDRELMRASQEEIVQEEQ